MGKFNGQLDSTDKDKVIKLVVTAHGIHKKINETQQASLSLFQMVCCHVLVHLMMWLTVMLRSMRRGTLRTTCCHCLRLHHAFVCMSQVPSYLIWFEHKTSVLHHIHPSQDEAPLISDFRCSGSPLALEGSIPNCLQLIRALTVHLCLHDHIKGDL